MNNAGTVIVVFAPSGSGSNQLWRGSGASFTQVAPSLAGLCASINDMDDTAYLRANYPTTSITSLVRNSGGTLTILARSDTAPYLFAGTTYLPSLSNSGSAVYLSRGVPGPGTNAGIYIGPSGTTVYNASTGPPLDSYTTASMNDSLTVAFVAQAAGKIGIYRGSTEPLIESGDVVSAGTIQIGLGRPVINSSGTVAFEGSTTGTSSLYTTSDGTAVALVGTGSIQRLALNDSGTVAYRKAMFNIGGVSQGSGLFVGRPGAIDQRVIGLGDALDGSTVHECFLWEEAINNHGQIAFWAHLADGRQGVYRANPMPVLTTLSPSSAAIGGAGFTLTVNGSHFVGGSQVRWNGAVRTTTYISDTQLQAAIPTSDLSSTGTVNITVVNPAPVTGTSNALPFTIGPTMALDKTTVNFGAVTSGTSFLFQTSPQVVRLTQNGAGTITWTATSNQPWLKVSPASGNGSANLALSVAFSGGLPSSGSLTGTVTLSFTGAMTAPGPVTVKLSLLSGTSKEPFGFVDTPIDHSTGVTGAVPFTGWMLDDVEGVRVMICRAAVGAEVAPVDANCAGQAQMFVGFPVFIDLARPDVAALYPEIPLNTRAGWGFMILTNMLPSQGNGTFVFYIWGQDREGHTKLLGTRTITCNNVLATKPFGAIDTPEQGGVASGGAYVNFGWALTPLPKTIPTDGSTISVLVDGVPVGNASYNNFRADIAGLFPGLNNTNGAIGFRVLDTTALTNGTHTIVWVVSDNQGAAEGIGSRFFSVSNGVGALTAAKALTQTAERGTSVLRQESGAIPGRRGWDLSAPLRAFEPDDAGRVVVRSEEVNRIELHLGQGYDAGYLKTNDGLQVLPIGSRIDASGVFTWAPGVGFVGAYDFVFVRADGDEAATRRDVRILLAAKGSGLVGPQVVIDAPRSQQDVAQPFGLGGWAAIPAPPRAPVSRRYTHGHTR